MNPVVTPFVRRVLLAAELDSRSEARALVCTGPAASCAALGSLVAHVVQTLVRDRKLMTTWLEVPKPEKV